MKYNKYKLGTKLKLRLQRSLGFNFRRSTVILMVKGHNLKTRNSFKKITKTIFFLILTQNNNAI